MDSQPTILVVDDRRQNRIVIAAILESRYRILEAESAETALEQLAKETVDLVLLDVMMPGTTGLELCRRLKAEPRSDFLPVVLVTALSEQEYRNAGLEAGADDFLTKPIDRRELLLRVRGLLTIRSQRARLLQLEGLKDDLASLLVHDLRNPLASIYGLLEGMQTELPPGSLREDVDGALVSADQMRGILDDLLEVRLLEEEKLTLHLERHPVWAVVVDAVAAVRGAAAARRVRVVLSGDRDVEARLDQKLVARALWNLTVNAVRYSPSDGVVDVMVQPRVDYVDIDVGDRGPGIPDAIRSHLFEKFRTEELSEGQRRGFGLGLYLVKLVATAHHGGITALERDGGGALFRLSLPLVSAFQAAPPSA